MPNPRYKTLVEYMERTGTSANRLLERVNKRLRRPLSPQLLSMIRSGSRRCSAENAWALHQATGVPMDELMRWPRYTESDKADMAVEKESCQ